MSNTLPPGNEEVKGAGQGEHAGQRPARADGLMGWLLAPLRGTLSLLKYAWLGLSTSRLKQTGGWGGVLSAGVAGLLALATAVGGGNPKLGADRAWDGLISVVGFFTSSRTATEGRLQRLCSGNESECASLILAVATAQPSQPPPERRLCVGIRGTVLIPRLPAATGEALGLFANRTDYRTFSQSVSTQRAHVNSVTAHDLLCRFDNFEDQGPRIGVRIDIPAPEIAIPARYTGINRP